MREFEFVVVNAMSCDDCTGVNRGGRAGLHMRPCLHLCDVANRYDAEIEFANEQRGVNVKDIMELSMLAATVGTVLEARVSGTDETIACAALADALVNGLGDGICPDFEEFRRSWVIRCGLPAHAGDPLSNVEALEAYAREIKLGRRCHPKKDH